MRVFMLGWEFPPFISGGLGTACHGLTKALNKQSVDVTFVLPKAVGNEYSSHVRLLSPQASEAATGSRSPKSVSSTYAVDPDVAAGLEGGRFKAVPSRIVSPYQAIGEGAGSAGESESNQPISILGASGASASGRKWVPGEGLHYGGDLLTEAQRYADLCVNLALGEEFDVIHAHDWLTYPAGLAIAAVTGKPLVVHVHSTEFDRSGENINQTIYDIERRGVHGAMRVVCVSYLTKSIIQHKYGVEEQKIDVVYNGIENGISEDTASRCAIRRGDRIVLFLGRITHQKGPEYFVEAARKVASVVDNAKFVVAGSGDRIKQMIEMAAECGIGQKFIFTGFLRGPDVEAIFKMADVYVMPSVSEPFGIAPLEAISHDVPVIISRTSGVAEVLSHALKVDFWDTDDIANKIIAVLRHPPLSSTLREHADMEIRRLTWDDAASKCVEVYHNSMALMPS